jgi:hypothetical protein
MSPEPCPHCGEPTDRILLCPTCGREGCPECIPAGNGCECPECEEGDDCTRGLRWIMDGDPDLNDTDEAKK